jgi:hypothetical protein
MNQTIIETKQNKKGVFEAVMTPTPFIEKVKQAAVRIRETVEKAVSKVKATYTRIAEKVKQSPTANGIYKVMKTFTKNISIAGLTVLGFGLILPGIDWAMGAAIATLSLYKTYKHINDVRFIDAVFEIFGVVCDVITATALVVWLPPMILDLLTYAWVWGVYFLIV